MTHGLAKADLHIYRGDTFTTVFEFADGDGTPLDLPTTGWRAHFMAFGKDEPTIFDVSAVENRVTVSLPAAITEGLEHGGKWDLELTEGGNVRTYVRGDVAVELDVTRG